MAIKPLKKTPSRATKKRASDSDLKIEKDWALALKIYPDLVKWRQLMSACSLEVERKFLEILVKEKKFASADTVADTLISKFLHTEFTGSTKLKNLILHSFKATDGILFLIELTPLLKSLGIDSAEAILKKISENHLNYARNNFHTFGFKNCLPDGVVSFDEEIREVKRLEKERMAKKERIEKERIAAKTQEEENEWILAYRQLRAKERSKEKELKKDDSQFIWLILCVVSSIFILFYFI